MRDAGEATRELLSERPDLEPALRELLAVDGDAEGWTFDDVALSSGAFGEIVSRAIVEDDGDGYTLADREAVAAVLDGPAGDAGGLDGAAGDAGGLDGAAGDAGAAPVDLRAPDPARLLRVVPRDEAAVVAAGLALVVLVRTVLVAEAVFRDGTVVLAGNDPYRFRFWVEQFLASDLRAFDPGALADLPEAVKDNDALMFVAMWWLAALIGGTPESAGQVLTWYPVVAAALVAVGVYWATHRLTGDPRAAVAAVLLFALTPVSAHRMMVGFGDHHAFDYLWLALTASSLLGVATTRRNRGRPEVRERPWRTGLLAAGVGAGVAGQVLAWRGGPLFVLPVAVYVVAAALLDVRDGRPVHRGQTPLVAGLGLATVATLFAHLAWGWLPPYRAAAPLLLLAGTLFTHAGSEFARHRGHEVRTTATALGATGALGAAVVWEFVPPVSRGVTEFVGYMEFYAGSGIAETRSLFSSDLGLFFAPVLLFSFVLFVALVPMVRATAGAIRANDGGWLVAGAYAWFFLVLALVQIRFAGPLAIFVAVFGGVGFVRMLHWLDLAAELPLFAEQEAPDSARSDERSAVGTLPPTPNAGDLASVATVFLLVVSMSFVQIPIRQHQIAIDETTYEASVWMDDYADQRGWEYPSNYVFSRWGRSHAYNHVVNGQTRSYGFAKEHYQQFVLSRSPAGWYERLHDRVGFVVTRDLESAPPGSMQARLHRHNGSASGNASGLAHFRAVYVSDDRSLKVFTLVAGATVTGTGTPNATVTATVEVDIPGASFVYRRAVPVGADGRYQFTTPYPGRYEVGGETVTVSERAVRTGGRVNASA